VQVAAASESRVIRYIFSGVLMILASPLVNAWPLVFIALAPD
jgi:hypothetical protein